MIKLSRSKDVNSVLISPSFKFIPIYTLAIGVEVRLRNSALLNLGIGDNSRVCTAHDTLAYNINTMTYL